MLTLFRLVHRAVTRRPGAVIAAVLVVSVGMGWLASQAVSDDAIAVDNEPARALEKLDEQFGDRQSVAQIVVTTDGAPVVSVDGLQASLRISRAIRSSPVAATLIDSADGPGAGPDDRPDTASRTRAGTMPPASQDRQAPPAVASYLGGVEALVAMQALDPSALSDAEVVALNRRAAGLLPAEVAGLFDALVEADDPATKALILVFQATAGLDDVEIVEQQRALADVVAAVDLPDGFRAETFSFGLLLGGTDIGPEVGRLFGTALTIILVVLALVYWLRPTGHPRHRLVRRTAADVALTLAVIVLAVVWMQGLGTLLGPGYLGVIGPFSPQTQIVPILIIGLGVDYAIHVSARYREELGSGRPPAEVVSTALRTVGVALVLATATTAVGFLTNLASPVAFLQTFGVLAAVGILAAFTVSVTLLPAARLVLDRRADARGRLPVDSVGSSRDRLLPRLTERTAVLAERAPVATLVVAAALAGLGGYGYTQLDTEFSITDFVPQDAPILEVFETLDTQFGGGFAESTDVLLEGELETPAAHNAVVASIERLAEVEDVGRIGDRADADSVVSLIGAAFAADDGARAEQLAALGVDVDARVAPDADLAAVYDLLSAAAPDAARQVLATTDGQRVGRVAIRTTAGETGAGELAEELEAAFAPAEEVGLTVTPTSQAIIGASVTADIEASQLTSLLIALAAAMLLLGINFQITARRPMLGVLTIAPVGLVLAYTFGTMAATGIPLTPVTATLAALAIGIGVPFTIHVTHRFQEMRLVLPDVNDALRATARRTGGALAGSALTTVIGFGVLTTSTLVPFSQLGFVTVYAIGYALLVAILVLPSLLVLWDRWHRRHDLRPLAADPRVAAGLRIPAQPIAPSGAAR